MKIEVLFPLIFGR